MKTNFVVILSLCFNFVYPQDSDFKLFLIGDTGEEIDTGETLKNFLDTISKYPNSAVVFLGDNSYKGWRGGFDDSPKAVRVLRKQLEAIKGSDYAGYLFFIPGNHDWWNKTCMKSGARRLLKEEKYIDDFGTQLSIKNKSNIFLPDNGNAFSEVSLNNDKLRLIILDTQWLLMQKNSQQKEFVYALLNNTLNDAINKKQKIVIAAHHPIYTISKHSKKRKWQFPRFWKIQDNYHPQYEEMRTKIDSIMHSKIYPVIYASGHDHVLEYFRKDSVQYIVSGAGSKSNQYCKRKNQDFNPNPVGDIPIPIEAKVNEGYFIIDFENDIVTTSMLYFNHKPEIKIWK